MSGPDRRRGGWWWVLVLPAVLAIVALRLDRERGPWWLGSNSDPSYQYLLNSLLVRLGQPPCHVDHPGTPLQSFGAAVLQATTPGRDAEEQGRAVLADPEAALARIHRGLLVLGVGGLALAGGIVLARTGSPGLALIVQAVPLLQVGTYRSTLFVDPEALLVPITALVVALLIAAEAGPGAGSAGRLERWLVVVLGLLAGVGLATKITFAPVCLLVLLTRRSGREAGLTLAALVVGALGALAPAFTELPRVLRWFSRLATHTGTYGTGTPGFVDGSAYLGNVLAMAGADRVLLVVGLVSLLAGLAGWRAQAAAPGQARPWRLLVFAAAVQGAGILLVAKHPHPRYLVPVAVSVAFNAALLVDLGRRAGPGRIHAWVRRGVPVAGLAAALLVLADLRSLTRELGAAREEQLAFAHEAAALAAGGRRADYYRSSSVAFALHFGNGTAWRFFSAPLAELHPGRLFYNRFTGRFETFSGPIPTETALAGPPLFLIGTGGLDQPPAGAPGPAPPGWELVSVQRRGEQTLHRLQPAPR